MKASRHMPNEAIEYQKLDATYVSLPPNVRKEIWKNTGLGSNSLVWREQIFDCDDFAFAAKAAVSRWAAENLRCDVWRRHEYFPLLHPFEEKDFLQDNSDRQPVR